jgi:hypothetical protein
MGWYGLNSYGSGYGPVADSVNTAMNLLAAQNTRNILTSSVTLNISRSALLYGDRLNIHFEDELSHSTLCSQLRRLRRLHVDVIHDSTHEIGWLLVV